MKQQQEQSKQYIVFKPKLKNKLIMLPSLPKIRINFSCEIHKTNNSEQKINTRQQQQQHKKRNRKLTEPSSELIKKKQKRNSNNNNVFNTFQCHQNFYFLYSVSQELLKNTQSDQPFAYLVLVKEFFDFFKSNHPEINSRVLLILEMDPEDDKYQVSFKQFETIDKLSKGAISLQDQLNFVCKIFSVGTTFTMDINEFILIMKLIFSKNLMRDNIKESIFEKMIKLLKAQNIINYKRHLINLSDLKNCMIKQKHTFSFLYNLIFYKR